MRKGFVILSMAIAMAYPIQVSAQTEITIESVEINLWPEYDKAEMLVIEYILLGPDTRLPITLDLRIPARLESPHVIAVGPSPDHVTDQGVNFSSRTEGEWSILSIEATGPAIQFEYYDPELNREGSQRSYAFEWISEYQVRAVTFTIQKPFDAFNFSSSPELQDAGIRPDQLQYYISDPVAVAAGETLALELRYEKPTDSLSASRLQVEPVGVDEDTPGRISFSNYLPYVIGGLGVVLIVGGIGYYWQSSRAGSWKPRRRVRRSGRDSENGSDDAYCHQCGARSHAGDRFCRTCGARLKT